MQNRTLKVINEAGLHARPAAEFVKEASRYQAVVQVRSLTSGSNWIDAKSILSVLTLGVARGHEIELRTDGTDESTALTSLADLIKSGFAGRL